MVSSSRPALRTTSNRVVRKCSPDPSEPHASAVATSSHSIPLRPAPNVPPITRVLRKHIEHNSTGSSPRRATRALSRDPAVLSPEISNHDTLKPPTKITVTQTHGELLRTTNGVRKRLKITDDGIASQASTPKPDTRNGTAEPADGQSQPESRSLRSKDVGSRLKSELSKFFPEYDDVMNDVPESPEFLITDEPILITNEPLKNATSEADRKPFNGGSNSISNPLQAAPAHEPSERQPAHNAKTISIGPDSVGTPQSDPLPDELYFKPHRRKENAEKRLRNRERENALHEKTQLERLLDDLQGPDWLRCLGVTGITEGERKSFEWKRNYFINEVKILLNKFRMWKEEEKRLKLQREEALARQEEEDEEHDSEEQDDDSDGVADGVSSGPPSSDIDAWAARQLLQEATQASGSRAKSDPRRSRARPNKRASSRHPSDEPDDRAGPRRRPDAPAEMIFGIPMPAFKTREFALPPSWTSPEALRANARKRRKLNRELKQEMREKGLAA